MDERNFEIGARKFKLNKIDVFKQLGVTKRLAPLMASLIPAAKALGKADDKLSQTELFDKGIAEFLAPVADGFAKMSDEDQKKVIIDLCSAVEMQQEHGNWARVANESAGLCFQDLDLPTLLTIAGRSFMFNCGSFFTALPQTSKGKA